MTSIPGTDVTPLTLEEFLAEIGADDDAPRRHMGPGPHKSGSPQSIHGSGGPNPGAAWKIGKQGGDSVHPITGRRPATGYMVAQPQGARIVPAEAWFDHGEREMDQFIRDREADFKADPDAFVGIWFDKKHAEFALDVSHNVQDVDEAKRLGASWDQQSIWDVVNQREIPTGGTGGRDGGYADQRSTAAGLLDDARGGAAGLVPADRRGDPGARRALRVADPEVVDALEEFHRRHLGPGLHPNGTPQSIHSGGGKSSANAKALAAAEGAGQRTMHPITSIAQLNPDQQASFGEIWQPYTRTRKEDGSTVTIQVERSELKRHLAGTIRRATPAEREAGMRWYQDAHDFGMDLAARYDVPPETAFKVIAALSPKASWGSNKTKAEKALRQFKEHGAEHADLDDMALARKFRLGFASGPNSDAVQAIRILRGEQGLPTGLKRQSFVNNMHHPENAFDVTVDGWVAGALQRSSHGLSERDALDWVARGTNQAKTTGLVVESKGYIAVADVVREVAAEFGMTPQQAQAVYWVAAGGGTGAAMWED